MMMNGLSASLPKEQEDLMMMCMDHIEHLLDKKKQKIHGPLSRVQWLETSKQSEKWIR